MTRRSCNTEKAHKLKKTYHRSNSSLWYSSELVFDGVIEEFRDLICPRLSMNISIFFSNNTESEEPYLILPVRRTLSGVSWLPSRYVGRTEEGSEPARSPIQVLYHQGRRDLWLLQPSPSLQWYSSSHQNDVTVNSSRMELNLAIR
jgi:hypothetical protein